MKQSYKFILAAFASLLAFVAIQIIGATAVQQLWRLVSGSSDQTVALLVTSSSVVSLLSIVVFLAARWAEVSPRWLRSRQWSVLLWSVVAAVGAVIPSAWLQEMMPELPNIAEQQFDMILRNRWGYLAVGLLAPVAEEIVFRGAVLRSQLHAGGSLSPAASSRSPLVPIVVSAVLFALVHVNPAQMPHAFLVGLLLGWMYWRTGSILPAVAFHWANNSIAYILYNVYPNAADLKLTDIFSGGPQHVLLAVGFSLMVLLPALFQLHLLMKPAAEES